MWETTRCAPGCSADVASLAPRHDAGMTSLAEPAREREHLLDRLQSLRAILPVFAQELASARRESARLRLQNRRLEGQVRQLQRQQTTRRDVRMRPGGARAAAPGRAKSAPPVG